MTGRFSHLTALSLAAGVLAAGPAVPALAQAEPPAPQAPAAAAVSEEDLKSFATATREVNRIAAESQAELKGSAQPEQARELETKAQARMVEAVKKHGLSVEKYNTIAMAAQADPTMRDRILQHMQEPR